MNLEFLVRVILNVFLVIVSMGVVVEIVLWIVCVLVV